MVTIKKSFGIDQETGLEKEILLSQINIDVINETITVIMDVNLIYPSGKRVKVDTRTYRRVNAEGSMKFTKWKDSSIGQGILSTIQSRFDLIQGFETINEDLEQKI